MTFHGSRASAAVGQAAPARGNAALRVVVWPAQAGHTVVPWATLRDAGLDAVSARDDQPAPGRLPGAILFWCPHRLGDHLADLRGHRTRFPQVPLVAAVDCRRDLDHVLAVESGADDVLDVSWSAAVIVARLRGTLLRHRAMAAGAESQTLVFGDLQVCRARREVVLRGTPVKLTESEFEMLWVLASHADMPVGRQDLLGPMGVCAIGTGRRSMDMRVCRLRSKLGHEGQPARGLRTVRRIGYLFCAQDW